MYIGPWQEYNLSRRPAISQPDANGSNIIQSSQLIISEKPPDLITKDIELALKNVLGVDSGQMALNIIQDCLKNQNHSHNESHIQAENQIQTQSQDSFHYKVELPSVNNKLNKLAQSGKNSLISPKSNQNTNNVISSSPSSSPKGQPHPSNNPFKINKNVHLKSPRVGLTLSKISNNPSQPINQSIQSNPNHYIPLRLNKKNNQEISNKVSSYSSSYILPTTSIYSSPSIQSSNELSSIPSIPSSGIHTILTPEEAEELRKRRLEKKKQLEKKFSILDQMTGETIIENNKKNEKFKNHFPKDIEKYSSINLPLFDSSSPTPSSSSSTSTSAPSYNTNAILDYLKLDRIKKSKEKIRALTGWSNPTLPSGSSSAPSVLPSPSTTAISTNKVDSNIKKINKMKELYMNNPGANPNISVSSNQSPLHNAKESSSIPSTPLIQNKKEVTHKDLLAVIKYFNEDNLDDEDFEETQLADPSNNNTNSLEEFSTSSNRNNSLTGNSNSLFLQSNYSQGGEDDLINWTKMLDDVDIDSL